MSLFSLLEDGIFAAIAAVGFAVISNPPRRILPYCALIAAIGHATRFALMNGALHFHITLAGFCAALPIGFLSIFFSRRMKCPSECFSFPALLPMIPGMYAYGAVQALVKCLMAGSYNSEFAYYFNMFNYNALVCVLVVLMLVTGITLPRLILKSSGNDRKC